MQMHFIYLHKHMTRAEEMVSQSTIKRHSICGSTSAAHSLRYSYMHGDIVRVDKTLTIHFLSKAAKGGILGSLHLQIDLDLEMFLSSPHLIMWTQHAMQKSKFFMHSLNCAKHEHIYATCISLQTANIKPRSK